MKRLLVISLLVVVVLGMTVGTAFASTCGASYTAAMACNGGAARERVRRGRPRHSAFPPRTPADALGRLVAAFGELTS